MNADAPHESDNGKRMMLLDPARISDLARSVVHEHDVAQRFIRASSLLGRTWFHRVGCQCAHEGR